MVASEAGTLLTWPLAKAEENEVPYGPFCHGTGASSACHPESLLK